MSEPNPYCGICAGTGREVVSGKTLTCKCTDENDILHYPNVSQLKKALAESVGEPPPAEPPKCPFCGVKLLRVDGVLSCENPDCEPAGSRPSAPAPDVDDPETWKGIEQSYETTPDPSGKPICQIQSCSHGYAESSPVDLQQIAHDWRVKSNHYSVAGEDLDKVLAAFAAHLRKGR